MPNATPLRLQLIVFSLVSASFANIYLTQPVLPILQTEFHVDMVTASFSVSAVILGMAIANLPFGYLSDKLSIRPIVLTGGICIAGGALICALTSDIRILTGARFFQGLFIPALTTCIAAYLAKSLPLERLNVIMGAYVSATVLGGMGGRLLGGFIHPPSHWRWAFISASLLVLMTSMAAFRMLPPQGQEKAIQSEAMGFLQLLKPWPLLRIYFCAAGGFGIFSAIFNYLPYRLTAAPFHFSTRLTTLLYLVYIVGIFMGPLAGKISNRLGTGKTLIGGAITLVFALFFLLLPTLFWIIAGLLFLCAGFFCIHASAVGALNRKLTSGQGRANAIYVLFYYVGGWISITVSGVIYQQGGWTTMIPACALLLIFPVLAGIAESQKEQP